MTQSIKISDHTKERIEKLRSNLLLNHNLKLSQLEIIEYLVDNALNDEKIIEKIRKDKQGLVKIPKEKKWEELLNNPPDYGINDISTDIDEHINMQK